MVAIRVEQGKIQRLGDQLVELDHDTLRLWVLDEQGERLAPGAGVLFAYEWVTGAQPVWLPLYYATGGDLGPGWRVLRGAPVRIDLTQLTEATVDDTDLDECFADVMGELSWEWS